MTVWSIKNDVRLLPGISERRLLFESPEITVLYKCDLWGSFRGPVVKNVLVYFEVYIFSLLFNLFYKES